MWQKGNAHVATPGQPNGPMKEEDKKVAYATYHGNLTVNKKTIKRVPSARFGESESQASTTSLGSVGWKESSNAYYLFIEVICYTDKLE